MTWHRLSAKQQDQATDFANELRVLGIPDADPGRCAEHLNNCFQWKRAEITLAQLCEHAGWTIPTDR
ncbi:hypothetical protein Aph01nite_69570 [Acrocarpospora phusangensis]|uniref:Uncharacterized protein n=1 Tax=Acrocarpospora phusangensis TaxID=1070424 RepID=A0A919QM24_9ACTN|nr:hypothetical protein [Acrocarpospora phusangensis]GIH28647.1 hypothetical protein Aph01nite_69570 [Acrocarpospora phusangensis]